MTCTDDEFCQVSLILSVILRITTTLQEMLTGDHCCFDIRGGLMGWQGGDPDWGKKCCDNKVAPVKLPPDNITQDQLDRVSGTAGITILISYFS